jgi:hypothetical protein
LPVTHMLYILYTLLMKILECGDVVRGSLCLMVKPGKVIGSLRTCDFVGLLDLFGEPILHTTEQWIGSCVSEYLCSTFCGWTGPGPAV